MSEVDERQAQGWVFRKTRLSGEFGFDDALATMPDDSHLLMVLRESGRLRFFTHAATPEPRPGDTVVAFTPPQDRVAERAAKRAEKKDNEARKPKDSDGKAQPA